MGQEFIRLRLKLKEARDKQASAESAAIKAKQERDEVWREYRDAAYKHGICPICDKPSRLCTGHAVYA